jgi:hypothetical protein
MKPGALQSPGRPVGLGGEEGVDGSDVDASRIVVDLDAITAG